MSSGVVSSRFGLTVLRLPRLGWSTRADTRAVLVSLALTLAALLVFAWSLGVGDFPISIVDVLTTLVGQGSEQHDFIVNTLRLPRGLTGLLVGAGFGLSGAIFQRLARNPLASPDIIGINAGAAAVAVFVIVVSNGSSLQITTGALVGALGAGISVYTLAYKRGVSGYRLVLVGIGLTAVFESITSYLLTRAQIYEVTQAVVWLTGSLNGRSWDHVRPISIALVILVPVALCLTRQLRMLELGDDAALGLGVRVERSRSALLLVATCLAAVGVASAGPVAFVSLVGPQIARRLVGDRSLALIPSMACGALLTVGADLAGRRVFAPTEMPVGIVTAIVGTPYLLYLLARANRVGSGG